MQPAEIFVSIAAYRDPQLAATLADCIGKAHFPDRLRFGICRQRDPGDGAFAHAADARVRLLEVDWRESHGPCWARAQIMRMWRGEPWYLQIDSHSRFAPGWDDSLITMLQHCPGEKSILSSYPAPFAPGHEENLAGGPLRIAMVGFTRDGLPQLRPEWITPPANGLPVPARFLAAGFIFAPGSFVTDVPYDPELYFMGEETTLTVRAYSQGYDLYHPAKTVIWHDYTRTGAIRHWDDHRTDAPELIPWHEHDRRSRKKVLQILQGEPVTSCGLGQSRSLLQYEEYAGVSFRHRIIQNYTLRGDPPPNPRPAPDWRKSTHRWIVKLEFSRQQMHAQALQDPEHWAVSIRDHQSTLIHQEEFPAEQLLPLQQAGDRLALVCEFYSETEPVNWLICPRSRSQGQLAQISGQFQEDDVAQLAADEPADAGISTTPEEQLAI